jgi:HPt (histidine-containing phosphotransfer) domain-containing protein
MSRKKRKLSQTDHRLESSKLPKQSSNESELVGQMDETIEELQQPLQENEDQTFPSQTMTPPSLSDTPSASDEEVNDDIGSDDSQQIYTS